MDLWWNYILLPHRVMMLPRSHIGSWHDVRFSGIRRCWCSWQADHSIYNSFLISVVRVQKRASSQAKFMWVAMDWSLVPNENIVEEHVFLKNSVSVMFWILYHKVFHPVSTFAMFISFLEPEAKVSSEEPYLQGERVHPSTIFSGCLPTSLANPSGGLMD